ncbi:MAG: LPS-assembly protein LptD [Roseiarcus sp.]|jgi:LPS-assembly protein
MGRSVSSPDAGGRRCGGALVRLALGFALILVAGSALAQSAATQGAAARNPDKLVVEANELVYDKDHNTVSAVGGVELYYKHRVLQADRVVYNRTTKRLYAEGRAKLTDEKGNVTYAKRFDLTDDFAAGFAEGVESVSTDRTRFTSPRVERSAGAVTVFNSGVYTACEPCKAHPERPPLWQVRAAKIIENQQTHVVYYEDAWLEVAGVPVAYIPYFSAPDPTVTRQSGLLAPTFTHGSYVGTGIGVPYFLDLAPNYDLTITPTYFTSQGPFLDAEWRQRLDHGQYDLRVNGLFQENPGLFPAYPWDSGDRRWRGSVESTGEFYLNDKWRWGWDITAMSDPFYLNDYKIKTVDVSQYYLQDVVSSVYLRGQADRGFFDLSSYRFESTSAAADQHQQPFAAPVLDYNKTIALSPEATGGIGGEIKIDLNAVNIAREEAAYQSQNALTLDQAYHLYNVCATGGTIVNGVRTGTYSSSSPSDYAPGKCLLRGIAGDYARVSEQVSWQRKFIDPLGETWTPFVFARLDGETAALNTAGTYSYGASNVYNSGQPSYFGGNESGSAGRAMPGVGLEYRYPLISTSAFGQQIFEPIAQLIVRPNEVIPKLQPNEDAQSLVFDETNLFAWDKYSGYDRVEGGTRLNYGAQYTANFANGGHANIVGGESIQLAGQNSYAIPDSANTGLESGLDKRFSNYVIGETIAPFSSNFSLTSKQQFDDSTLALTRLDVIANASYGGFTTSIDYGRYAAQPELGYIFAREGLLTNASYKLDSSWTVDGSVLFDMSRHYYDQPGQTTPRLYAPSYAFGLTYGDTCTTLKVRYSSTNTDPIDLPGGTNGPAIHDQTLLVQLTLRTLGEVGGAIGLHGSGNSANTQP